MEYTKGKWELERVPTQVGHAWNIKPIHACIYVDQQYIPHDLGNTPSIEAKANAHLIASAPDMYEALRYIIEDTMFDDKITNWQKWREKAVKVLNKAEGKV
jgi:hypothetical protein